MNFGAPIPFPPVRIPLFKSSPYSKPVYSQYNAFYLHVVAYYCKNEFAEILKRFLYMSFKLAPDGYNRYIKKMKRSGHCE